MKSNKNISLIYLAGKNPSVTTSYNSVMGKSWHVKTCSFCSESICDVWTSALIKFTKSVCFITSEPVCVYVLEGTVLALASALMEGSGRNLIFLNLAHTH